ncbi:MAG: copper resistance CopC/CopD family protein, partial [Actinomycetes bacterium]
MHGAPRSIRARRRAVAWFGVALVAFGLLPVGDVAAHATLEASIPAPSSVLEEAPEAIVLDFDESIEPGLSSIEVFDAEALPVEVGDPVQAPSDDTVVQASLPDLDDGVYAVVWRVASADGHVVDGAFSFSIGTGGGEVGDLLDRVTGDARASSSVTTTADVARWVLYLGLVLLLGAGGWTLFAGGEVPGVRRQLPVIGWAMAMLSSLALYGLYGAEAVAGTLADAFSPEVWGRIDGTQTGRMILVRIALLAILGVLLALRSRRAAAWWTYGMLLAGLGSLITLPAAGHPSATSPRALYVALDMVHLTAIVGWMGGLALLGIGSASWLQQERAQATVRAFSRTATVLVPVIVGTGVVPTVELAGGVDKITDTDWGRTRLVTLTV